MAPLIRCLRSRGLQRCSLVFTCWQSLKASRWYRRRSWLFAIQRAHKAAQLEARHGAPPATSAVDSPADASSGQPRKRAATTASVLVDDVSLLLLDRRLLRCRGPLVADYMVGIATSFLQECCEDPTCPTMQPVAYKPRWTDQELDRGDMALFE